MNRPIHGGNRVWAAKIAGCSLDSLVDFSASINPLGPPQSAIAAIQGGLSDLNAYPDPNYSQLRCALAQWHHLSPEWILPGNGVAELLTWASWEFAQCAQTYLITPAFSDYWRALRTFGVNVKTVPLKLNQIDARLFFDSIEPSSGLLLNNPHNPTGKLFDLPELLDYLEKFDLVVVDEAFMDFLPPMTPPPSLIDVVERYPNLVILRSLTKFYSIPGLRLGYAITHPNRLQQWQQWRDPWCVNSLAEKVGKVVIFDDSFQQKTWDWLIPTRKQLFEQLNSLNGLNPFPSSANFLLVETEYPSSQLQEILLKQYQLLIRDCLSFPELGDRYFRVAVRTEAENNRLIKALSELGDFLNIGIT